MSDPFDAFETALDGQSAENSIKTEATNDPAAEFLAREQVELAKIENENFDTFGDFGSSNFELKKETTELEMNDQFGISDNNVSHAKAINFLYFFFIS